MNDTESVLMDQKSAEFHIAEYTSIHGEIRELLQEARSLERYTTLGIGAIWAWLFANNADMPGIAWFIPVFFVFMGIARQYVLENAVTVLATYLCEIESVLATSPHLMGWETTRMKNNEERRKSMSFTAKLFSRNKLWLALAASTMITAIYMNQ